MITPYHDQMNNPARILLLGAHWHVKLHRVAADNTTDSASSSMFSRQHTLSETINLPRGGWTRSDLTSAGGSSRIAGHFTRTVDANNTS